MKVKVTILLVVLSLILFIVPIWNVWTISALGSNALIGVLLWISKKTINGTVTAVYIQKGQIDRKLKEDEVERLYAALKDEYDILDYYTDLKYENGSIIIQTMRHKKILRPAYTKEGEFVLKVNKRGYYVTELEAQQEQTILKLLSDN